MSHISTRNIFNIFIKSTKVFFNCPDKYYMNTREDKMKHLNRLKTEIKIKPSTGFGKIIMISTTYKGGHYVSK